MDWKRLFGLRRPKTTEELVDATDIDAVIRWCRYCHDQYPVPGSSFPGKYLMCLPAWWAVPAFLALKKIGFSPDVPAKILDPIVDALAADATEEMSGMPASEPEMQEIYAAMKLNLRPHIRFWLAAFQKVKRSYFRDKVVLAAMLRAIVRLQDGDLADRFSLSDEEAIDDFVRQFGGLIRYCNGELRLL